MSQYLDLTFSVMVLCTAEVNHLYTMIWKPVVLAIDEDYDTLLSDLGSIFVADSKLTRMKVCWEAPRGQSSSWPQEADMNKETIPAMLRLLKSLNGKNHIEVR